MNISKVKVISSLIVLCFALSPIFNVHAENFYGGFSSGNLTYGIGGGSSSIASTASSQWNGVSSNASYTYSSATDQYGSTARVITYFDIYTSANAGELGLTIPYKSYTGISASEATTNGTWVKAVVYQYKATELDTTTKKIATASHELGHALSVAHPTTSNGTEVMRQGVKTSYTLTTYDKNSLKAKWGN